MKTVALIAFCVFSALTLILIIGLVRYLRRSGIGVKMIRGHLRRQKGLAPAALRCCACGRGGIRRADWR